MKYNKYSFLIIENPDKSMQLDDMKYFLDRTIDEYGEYDLDDIIFTFIQGSGKLYHNPINVFADMISNDNKEFNNLYGKSEYKLFIPKFDIGSSIYNFYPTKNNLPDRNASEDECDKYEVYKFIVDFSSDFIDDLSSKYIKYAVNLTDNDLFKNIDHIYAVSFPEINITIYAMTRNTNFTANDLVYYVIEDYASIRRGLSEIGISVSDSDDYNVIHVPFNRSQPSIKGDICGKCIIKSKNEIKDTEAIITEVYNKGDYNA